MNFEEQTKKSDENKDKNKPEEVKEEAPEEVEEAKKGVAEKELTKEEKEENRKKFLEKETEDIEKEIDEENECIKLYETRQKGGLIKKEYTEEMIKHLERVKTIFEQFRMKEKSSLSSKIEEFLKHSSEECQSRMAENKEKIEKLKPDLEDLYKKHMAKENIKDIEEENRILEAIKEGKF